MSEEQRDQELAKIAAAIEEALPHEDRRRVLAGCEPVDLAFTDVLMEPG